MGVIKKIVTRVSKIKRDKVVSIVEPKDALVHPVKVVAVLPV